MKNILTIISLTLVCIIFSGCPYDSIVPIGKATEKINPLLLGKWSEEHFEFNISKQDEFNYFMYLRNKYTNEYLDTCIVFTTSINGSAFINVKEVKGDGKVNSYLLYKVEMNGDKELKLFPMTSDIKEKFSTSDSLKTFITATMKHEGFFEGPMILTRIP